MRLFALPLVALALGTSALSGCTSSRPTYDPAPDRRDTRWPDRRDTRWPDRRDTRWPDRRDTRPADRTYDRGREIARLPGDRTLVRNRDGRLLVRSRDGRVADYGTGRATVCHRGRLQPVADNAVSAHLRHGDAFGTCRYDRRDDRRDQRVDRDDDDRGRDDRRGRGDGDRRHRRGHDRDDD